MLFNYLEAILKYFELLPSVFIWGEKKRVKKKAAGGTVGKRKDKNVNKMLTDYHKYRQFSFKVVENSNLNSSSNQ